MKIKLILLLCAFILIHCDSSGGYQLSWTIEGETITTSRQCSESGIDRLSVVAKKGSSLKTHYFSCFSDEGATAIASGLDAGDYEIQVMPISLNGISLSTAKVVNATIPEEGIIELSVDLDKPPACRDGIDNDNDGLVDYFDPDCYDMNQDYDPTLTSESSSD